MAADRRDGADRLLTFAVWLLAPARREWGSAMRAELSAISPARARWGFAGGCLGAVVWPGQVGRAARYAVLVAVVVAAVVFTGGAAALRVEAVGLAVVGPVVVWRLGYREAVVGVVAANGAARMVRSLCVASVAGCLAVGVVTIAVTLPRYGGGATGSGAVGGLTLLAGLLAVYTALGLAVTSRRLAVAPVTLAAGSGAGVAAGLAWCVLMPFDQTLSVPGRWATVGYGLALAVVAVGAPAAAAAVAGRRTRAVDQAVVAAAVAGGLAALVILAGGWATVWALPGLLDTPLLDKGPSWRPPDVVEQVITSYLALLVAAPVLTAFVGWCGGRLVTASRAGRLVAAVAVAAGAALAYPALNVVAGGDGTRFGGVGATDVVFSPAGGTLLTSNGDRTWILWDVADPGWPRRLHTFNDQVVYSPDGLRLASRNVLWSLSDPARPARTAGFDAGAPVAFDLTGSLLATHPTRATTTLWGVTDPAHPVRLGTVPGGGGGGGAFTPDGHTLVVRDDVATTLWDVQDPARPVRRAVLGGGDEALLAPDGAALVIVSADGAVLWNVADRARPRRVGLLAATTDPANPGFRAHPVFSPDGRSVAVGHGDGGVSLFDAATGAPTAALPPTPGSPNNAVQIGASDTLTTLAFTPDGRTLSVITGNATVSVWNITDPRTPVRTRILTRRTAGPGRVGFSPDTTTVAGAADDGSDSVTLWRLDRRS